MQYVVRHAHAASKFARQRRKMRGKAYERSYVDI